MSLTIVSFPERLRLLRAKVNLTQVKFAKALGISRQTINTVERGRWPTPELIEQIDQTFGIDLKSPDFYNKLEQLEPPENLPEAA